MSRPTVMVIGAGVAGSSCALRLRHHGIDVTLVEKDPFPRAKVCGCCLGGAGLETFQQLSLRQWLETNGAATHQWQSSLADRLVQLDLPSGVAISREKLDTHLLHTAQGAGAQVRVGCSASIAKLSADDVSIELDESSLKTSSRHAVVVVAGGLNAKGLQEWLPWRERPNGPFGVSFSVRCDAIQPGVIYMACDHDGYVGLVKLENERVDVAAALSSGAQSAASGSPKQRVDAILSRSHFPRWTFHEPSPLMATPPLRRSRSAGFGRVMVIGDAAGYVEPFTGEGMTWAAQSGIAAADSIAASIDDLAQIGTDWNRQHRALLRRKKIACRVITAALRSPAARRVTAIALSHWPSLAKPLVRSLNSP